MFLTVKMWISPLAVYPHLTGRKNAHVPDLHVLHAYTHTHAPAHVVLPNDMFTTLEMGKTPKSFKLARAHL